MYRGRHTLPRTPAVDAWVCWRFRLAGRNALEALLEAGAPAAVGYGQEDEARSPFVPSQYLCFNQPDCLLGPAMIFAGISVLFC